MSILRGVGISGVKGGGDIVFRDDLGGVLGGLVVPLVMTGGPWS